MDSPIYIYMHHIHSVINFTIFSLVICTVAHRLISDFFFRIVPGEASPVVEFLVVSCYIPLINPKH